MHVMAIANVKPKGIALALFKTQLGELLLEILSFSFSLPFSLTFSFLSLFFLSSSAKPARKSPNPALERSKLALESEEQVKALNFSAETGTAQTVSASCALNN